MGGTVSGVCTGSRITDWAAEPADGWGAISASTEAGGGVRTGVQHPGQQLVVHITCSAGSPVFRLEPIPG